MTLRSGRLPRAVPPGALRGAAAARRGAAAASRRGCELVEVGEAVLNNRVLFGDFLAPTDNALADAEVSPSLARAAGYHRPPPPPLFLAEGVDALAERPALDAHLPQLRLGRPARAGPAAAVGGGRARRRRDARALRAPGVSSSFDLVAPVEELREAQATSRAAGRRLGIVGGEAAALLFAFALLAAMTLRTDLAAARRRLAWYGARGWQLAL